MALTKEVRLQRVEIREDEQVYVFEDHIILEDGKEVGVTRHGRVIDPDADVTGEQEVVQDVAKGCYTAKRKAAIKARKKAAA